MSEGRETGSYRIGYAIVGAGAVLLFCAYFLTFRLTTGDSLQSDTVASLRNTVPAIALGVIFHEILRRFVWTRGVATKLVSQVPLAILFSLAWYLAILVSQGLREGWLETGFSIRPFVPIAFVWQMFQGVTFYAVVALASLAFDLSGRIEEAHARNADRPFATTAPSTVLIRIGDENLAVALDEICSISGAGNNSEVFLPGRTLRSATTLADFDGLLPEDGFLRLHRSHIVRLGAIVRTEPAGNGRTNVHLIDGRSIIASRAGSRLLREAAL